MSNLNSFCTVNDAVCVGYDHVSTPMNAICYGKCLYLTKTQPNKKDVVINF